MAEECNCSCHGNEAPTSLHIVACCEGQCRHCNKYIKHGLQGHERACPDIQRLRRVQESINTIGGMAIKMTHVLGEAYAYIAATPVTVGREIILKKITDALT